MKNAVIKILIFLYISAFLFSGCKGGAKTVVATGPQKPASEIEGFFEQHQTVNGGTQANALNLADVKITKLNEEETQLILSFGQGSPSADTNIVPSKVVPQYKTAFVEGINRIKIQMSGISYWSYKIYEEELEGSIFEGVFVQRPVDTEESYFYININTDYAYKIEEYLNQIIITFHSLDTKEESSYYVTLNAFDEYEKGMFGDEFEMYPTLSSDKENILLLSESFESRELAQAFVDENVSDTYEIVPGKSFSITELYRDSLPTLSEESGFTEIANTPIGWKDDNPISFTPLVINGRFLSMNADKTKYAYAQPNIIYGDQEGDTFRFEYLYQADISGKTSERLLDYQFSSITSAQFSYDSKYLAFIDQNDLSRMLQILSLEDGKLYIPSEDSFGIQTASFTWADDKNVLYAINGDFQSKQLLSYDLTDPNDVKVEGIFEQEFNQSILQLNGDKIYYADRDGEELTSQICELDITTGTIKKITDGYSFLLSPSGDKLIINDMETVDGSESYRLRYTDLLTGEETSILSGVIISDVAWSTNGERIYYSIYRDAGWNVQYPNALYYYDIKEKQSVYIMDMITGALYTSLKDEEILVMCIFTYQKQPVPVTYIVK